MLAAEGCAELRGHSRSNVFLNAVLLIGRRTQAVRLRNISQRGALVDCGDVPPDGSAVELVRGSLSVECRIAWQEGGHCGLNFESPVVVDDWVRRIEHSGQQRVDEVICDIRRFGAKASPEFKEEQDSLDAISADLTEACERLALFPDLLKAYGEELLRLDAIAGRLANRVASHDPSQGYL